MDSEDDVDFPTCKYLPVRGTHHHARWYHLRTLTPTWIKDRGDLLADLFDRHDDEAFRSFKWNPRAEGWEPTR